MVTDSDTVPKSEAVSNVEDFDVVMVSPHNTPVMGAYNVKPTMQAREDIKYLRNKRWNGCRNNISF